MCTRDQLLRKFSADQLEQTDEIIVTREEVETIRVLMRSASKRNIDMLNLSEEERAGYQLDSSDQE